MASRRRAAEREKVRKVMREFAEGRLHSGSKRGPRVRSRRQAIALSAPRLSRRQRRS